MNRRLLLLPLAALLAAALLSASFAHAATGPLWDVRATWGDTNLPPGGEGQFQLQVRNVGDEFAEQDLTIEDELSAGVEAVGIFMGPNLTENVATPVCSGVGTGTVKCVLSGSALTKFGEARPFLEESGSLLQIFIDVKVAAGAPEIGTNLARVQGGGDPTPLEDEDQVPFSPTPSPFGVVPGSFKADVFTGAYPAGVAARQAGGHPFEQRVEFELDQLSAVGVDGTRYVNTNGLLKAVEATLPRGSIGNPEATPKCDPVNFAEKGSSNASTACPADTQVGYLNVPLGIGTLDHGRRSGGHSYVNPNAAFSRIPIYSLVPPKGQAADFALNVLGLVQAHIYFTLDPAQDYAIRSVTPEVSAFGGSVRSSEVTIWGVPGDPAHDKFRYYPKITEGKSTGTHFGSAAIRPLITDPSDCGEGNGGALIRVESYQRPGVLTPAQESPNPLDVEGCEDPRFRFEPKIALRPTDRHAGAPTGLDVHLEVPQRNDEVTEAGELYPENGFVKGIATPPIKKAVVTFPEGMTLNPSAAQGLGSCTLEQVGISPQGVPNDNPVTCPDSSQYGTLTVHTPLFPPNAPLKGHIYIAKQGENPNNNFLSLYLVVEEPDRGILVKVPGKVDLDPNTGQITTTFDEIPQTAVVSDMQMSLKGGVRAGLVNPSTCGKKTITAEFFTWQDPSTPHTVKNSYEITERPDGSPCVNSLGERPFKPALTAGTLNNTAGAYSPFVMRLTRADDDQEFSQLGVTLPPGLAAKFAGVAQCSDTGIAQAISRTRPGDGALEQNQPSCPASSLIGATQAGAGVGVPLTYVPGKVYLAGPYRGAPLSVVVISPAVVGPFDLGVIAVRTALNVNPVTAQGSATSDPFPQIFQGIPVRIRDIRLNLDRPDFTLNPTSCAEKRIAAHVTGTGGDLKSTADDTAAELTNRFQAADCASLGFKPKLSFHLFGGTNRGSHPRLKAVVKMPKGGANIAGASVALPRSEFLDQGHIKTVCTRVQFTAHQCPAGSVYGHAVAKTPLFDTPLEGPVYLRSSSHNLPDLVAVLKGPASEPVEVDLDGRVDSVNGGIRNTFEVVPDAPVQTFTLTMQGGKKGLLVNSTDLCAKTNRATAKFTAQNGRVLTLHPAMQSSCGKHGKKHQKHRR